MLSQSTWAVSHLFASTASRVSIFLLASLLALPPLRLSLLNFSSALLLVSGLGRLFRELSLASDCLAFHSLLCLSFRPCSLFFLPHPETFVFTPSRSHLSYLCLSCVILPFSPLYPSIARQTYLSLPRLRAVRALLLSIFSL